MKYKILISPLVFGAPILREFKTFDNKTELDLYLSSLTIVKELNSKSHQDLVLNFIPNTVSIVSHLMIKSLVPTLIDDEEQIFIIEVAS